MPRKTTRQADQASARAKLVDAIGFAISRWQDAVEDFDNVVGSLYGLSGSERRCLSLVSHAPQPASVIARETNLTPAAVTTLVDRLEARRFVRRQSDAADRRKVLVAPDERTAELVAHAYRPVFEAGAALLAAYATEELALVLRFIHDVEELQKNQTQRLRSQGQQEDMQPDRSRTTRRKRSSEP